MAAFSETDRLKALFAGSPLDSFEISRSPATSETQSRNNASFTKDLVKPNLSDGLWSVAYEWIGLLAYWITGKRPSYCKRHK
jgi:hypothetical protein